MNMEVYASSLASHITTLEHVFIRVVHDVWPRKFRLGVGRYWRIVRNGVQMRLQAVDKDEATSLADAHFSM